MEDISTIGGDADVMETTAPPERHPEPLAVGGSFGGRGAGRIGVTGSEGSLSIIDPIDMTAKTVVVQRGTAAAASPDGDTTRKGR
jgi:hypothetical protein